MGTGGRGGGLTAEEDRGPCELMKALEFCSGGGGRLWERTKHTRSVNSYGM